MAASVSASLISGASLGAALCYAGMSSPDTIVAQLSLKSFHMLKVFLTATASSALIIALLDTLGFLQSKPRKPVSLGHFSLYDGNIVGGLVFGIGMSLSGSCPGTVFTQLAQGILSARLALVGGVAGSALYQYLAPRLPCAVPSAPDANTPLTIQDKLGIPRRRVLPVFVFTCTATIALVDYIERKSGESNQNSTTTTTTITTTKRAVAGGLLIGAAQLLSVLLTSYTIGVSAAFKQPILYALQIYHSSKPDSKSRPKKASHHHHHIPSSSSSSSSHTSTAFAVGVFLGALAFLSSTNTASSSSAPYSTLTTTRPPAESSSTAIPPMSAFLGGAATVFGARLAGGCTSGHGISGMSMLSLASFVTVASMFAGGIGTVALLRGLA